VAQCAVLQDVPEYVRWIAQGKVDQALASILARNPLPGVTGHVCTHLCQTRCTRSASNYDEPVAIRALKRFAVAHGRWAQPDDLPPDTGRRVAVIGGGPSGLAAAAALAINGVGVTIYESRDRAGGMLTIAPAFRLPPEVVQADIDRILGLGVQLELAHPVTEQPEALLARGYDAVYVACGFARDAGLEIEGIDGEGVYTALDFLQRTARGDAPRLGPRVLVVGGGNTAMDAARTAQRLTGQPATVVYRRTRAEMPAEAEELADLLAEGNALVELVSPAAVVLREGRVAALACVRNALGEPDADGRRRPQPVAGSRFEIGAETVILAIGQRPDVTFLDGSGVSLRGNGAVVVDPETGRAGAPGVYAGGDVARGPAIIVQACADGRRAAEAICAQLGIEPRWPVARAEALSEAERLAVRRARARKGPQHRAASLPVAQRGGFDLVEQTLTEEAARQEAARCLQCATVCDKCVEVCPNRANVAYTVSPVRLALPRFACRDGGLVAEGEERFEVTQERQIVHVDDLCNECGNCATFCVHQGRPYADKPRLFLQRSGFEGERDNAFYLDGDTIWRRAGGKTCSLRRSDDGWVYETAQARVQFSADCRVEAAALKTPFEGRLSLIPAAEMALILDGIAASLPFLPIG
jgi:putative selenate reductase